MYDSCQRCEEINTNLDELPVIFGIGTQDLKTAQLVEKDREAV